MGRKLADGWAFCFFFFFFVANWQSDIFFIVLFRISISGETA